MRTLVLNAGYEPLAVVSFKRALLLVMNQKATSSSTRRAIRCARRAARGSARA